MVTMRLNLFNYDFVVGSFVKLSPVLHKIGRKNYKISNKLVPVVTLYLFFTYKVHSMSNYSWKKMIKIGQQVSKISCAQHLVKNDNGKKRTKTSKFSVWNGICLIETLFIGFTTIANSNSTARDDPPCLLPMDRILRQNCDLQCLRHQNELSPPSHAFPWPADSRNRISIGKMDQLLEVLLHCNNTHHFYQVRKNILL